ncbi:MAG: hypothetical protein ACTSVL_06735 [Promethearchaeota archaeon]
MNKIEKGELLLKNHKSLKKTLLIIPDSRKMIFNEEKDGNIWFGKPRFIPPNYNFDASVLTKLKNHLQSIWNFFQLHSYWFDKTIYPLLAWDQRRAEKGSIIFLLEKDVWNTREVYGKYLIEVGKTQTEISYHRFDNKYNKQTLDTIENEEIKKYILDDARSQIKRQFLYLWEKLESEILSCIKDDHTKIPRKRINSQNIFEQLEICEKIVEKHSEMVLLNIGRLAEYILLILLGKKQKGIKEDLVNLAFNAKLIDKSEEKLFNQIRRKYNALKHRLEYHLDIILLEKFIHSLKKYCS